MEGTLLELYRHKTWATLRLIEFCGRLDDAMLDATVPGTYGSIRETLRHLVRAEEGYFNRITGRPMSERVAADGPVPPLVELASRIERLGPEWERLAADDETQAREVTTDDGWRLRADVIMAQAVHHADDHRTHVLTILGGHGEYFGGLGGGQAEYVVVPNADHTMEPIPDDMADEQAIFVGDILATGYFGAERAEIKPGDVVAVVGAGPVGLLATMCAQLFGPARTFVIDMVDSRLEVAQELGGIPINARETHPVQAIEKATGGVGADSSIECVGLLAAVDTAIHVVRGGGTISMVGVPSAVQGDFPYLRMWLKSLTFRAGWCNVQMYMRPLLDLIAAGRLQPEKIISHRMKLDEAEEAYRIFDAREATKIVLTP